MTRVALVLALAAGTASLGPSHAGGTVALNRSHAAGTVSPGPSPAGGVERGERKREARQAPRVLVGASVAAAAQGRFFGYGQPVLPNPPYDGQFTFARLRYGPALTMVGQRVPWSHDYPWGERNFMRILDEVSYLNPKLEETSVLGLDDPELFRHPIAYMAEPGFWTITAAEAENFRAWLEKGGFVIFDDFAEDRGGWAAFEYAFRRVLPAARFYDLDASHQIFHSFFEIDSLDILPQHYDIGRPVLRAVFEDNDPAKRMMAMINFNTDISEYWEEGNQGFRPVWETNEAYKLGVNYVLYGMTH